METCCLCVTLNVLQSKNFFKILLPCLTFLYECSTVFCIMKLYYLTLYNMGICVTLWIFWLNRSHVWQLMSFDDVSAMVLIFIPFWNQISRLKTIKISRVKTISFFYSGSHHCLLDEDNYPKFETLYVRSFWIFIQCI